MISQLFSLIFLLIVLQPHLICALQPNKCCKTDLNNFSGLLRRGDHNPRLVYELKKRIMYLGYLHPTKLSSENYFDYHLEYAIKQYQKFYNLNVTGVVDINTMTSICKPRCGVPDFFSPQTSFKSLYSFYPGNPRWPKSELKYKMADSVIEAHRLPIEQALRAWQSATHFRFFPLYYYVHHEADITISFERGDHGDGYPFKDDTMEMAHGFKPPSGMLHFNAEKRWASDGDPNAYDIFTVALHELGHVLGLAHSTVPEAIMFPHLGPGERKFLNQDDIEGIKALYGF